jgi:hypothetical protein
MALVVGQTYGFTAWCSPVNPLHSFHGLGLLHKIFITFSMLVSGLYMLYHNFYYTFSCYLLMTKPDIRCFCSCSYIDVGWPVVEMGSFYWTQRSRCFPSLFWGRKQTQLLNKLQKPSNPECMSDALQWFTVDCMCSYFVDTFCSVTAFCHILSLKKCCFHLLELYFSHSFLTVSVTSK